METLQVRIVKVTLKNKQTEILLTNLPNEIASPQELKKLYNTRWTIETVYDRLKNKLQLEQFTGNKKIRIEQDFYSTIFIYNLIIAHKVDAEEKIKDKNNNTEYTYHPNINRLTGEIKEEIFTLLTEIPEKIKQTLHKITKIAQKDLVRTKTNPPTNQKRQNKKNYHKKCKSNLRDAF